jgi:alpha-beta hydrolase superfamily lysophospholipase
MRRLAKWLLAAVAAAGALLILVVLVFAILARATLPDLRPWHRLTLKEEFHAGRPGAPATFAEYLRLEDRLFAELHRKLLDDPASADTYSLSRYRPGSVPARLALETKYNRSYELAPQNPVGAVFLVHGLTDSPYSMRSIAETCYAEGFHVVVLRLRGHGTIPGALRDVSWRDWYAAVVLAARRASEVAGPDKPFLAGGHSTGAALVTLYALRSLVDPSLRRPSRLYLVSPAIGVSKFAVLTNVLAGFSFLPYFEKSKWLDVFPEYDPYKYNSFPVNAANQIYALTRELQSELAEGKTKGRLGSMPPITAFQSLVDATILASDVVRGLLIQLPGSESELVVFDVNRADTLQALVSPRATADLQRLNTAPNVPFRLTIIGNRSPSSLEVGAFSRAAGSKDVVEEDLPLSWPRGVLSLGHVALPFPIDDPVYGLTPADGEGLAYKLGALSARGEMGAMVVPLDTLARLRSNPFFDVLRTKIRATLGATVTRPACRSL